jgi:hypothetical protein
MPWPSSTGLRVHLGPTRAGDKPAAGETLSCRPARALGQRSIGKSAKPTVAGSRQQIPARVHGRPTASLEPSSSVGAGSREAGYPAIPLDRCIRTFHNRSCRRPFALGDIKFSQMKSCPGLHLHSHIRVPVRASRPGSFWPLGKKQGAQIAARSSGLALAWHGEDSHTTQRSDHQCRCPCFPPPCSAKWLLSSLATSLCKAISFYITQGMCIGGAHTEPLK